ncbi:transglycosylase domain-containing protein [Akkermansiaceae bacterium]|nr:transglycosylase domain-containing protein [Akkermansiaceae bacterium]
MHPVFKWPARLAGAVAVMMAMFGFLVLSFYAVRAMTYDLAKVSTMPARTVVYARDGRTELGKLHGENRYIVKYDEVAKDFKNALVSREDARFYKHFGIDPRSLARAVVENIKRRSFAQGGSTLSIQLAENTFFEPDAATQLSKVDVLDQKFLEMALALRIEFNFEKEEILEHYMNRIFWGHSIRGIEAASRTYFEKPASQLTLSESAMLAGIIRGPNAFSPFRSIDRATSERNVTLGRMVNYEHITQAQADAAKREPLRVRSKSRRTTQPTYAMDALRRELDRILEEENIKSGGLIVVTTVDHTIQRSAELAVDRNLAKVEKLSGYKHQTRHQWLNIPEDKRQAPAYLQGACVVMKNKTGEVLAVVGGRSALDSRYNRAIQAKRQIGSIFKPFVYLTAFNSGMMPHTWIPDGKIKLGEIRGADPRWSPANSDGKYDRYITAEDALVRSRNTSSVRVGDYAGLNAVNQMAMNVGFVEPYSGKTMFVMNPSAYLGTWEATPWQVASAYTVFPNNGDWYRPYIIKEIRKKNKDGIEERLYPSKGSSGKLLMSAAAQGATRAVSKTLEQVVNRGTGKKVRNLGFTAPCGGKTGTTDDYKDAWFAGYTANITCAVWVGLDTPKQIINQGYGSALAAPIWVDVMKTAGQLGYATPKFQTVKAKKVNLCRWSAKRATRACAYASSAYTTDVPLDMIPAEDDYCTIHR